jgi:Na+/H+ antiporter NhaD/arsenite permease-like protein
MMGQDKGETGGAEFRLSGELSCSLSHFLIPIKRRIRNTLVIPVNPIPVLCSGVIGTEIPLWLSGPFVLLLCLIALAPVLPDRLKHLWERHYPLVSLGLGGFVVLVYWLRIGDLSTPLHTGIEYFSFITLIGSLFVVSGGVHIDIRGEARPVGNVIFLLVGAVLANLIGTTGASMVLIRPFIRMNRYRVTGFHIVFFIFIISNLGGALTPIGDPPLFLGYLHGIPFFWIMEHSLLPWAFSIGCMLAIFYLYDSRNFLRAPKGIREKETRKGPLVTLNGAQNLLYLGLVVVAVFLPEQYFIREWVMIGAAVAAYRTTSPKVRQWNSFSFGPIREVAVLFAGIFMTMMPALGILKRNGHDIPLRSPTHYYLASGGLSSMLDNAPTYLTFLQLEQTAIVPKAVRQEAKLRAPDSASNEERLVLDWMRDTDQVGNHGQPAYLYILAVSLGAVFFGAMTYIGNGPNFMVKAIAESSHVRMPSFFGYIFKYSLPLLLPVLLVVGWLFL